MPAAHSAGASTIKKRQREAGQRAAALVTSRHRTVKNRGGCEQTTACRLRRSTSGRHAQGGETWAAEHAWAEARASRAGHPSSRGARRWHAHAASGPERGELLSAVWRTDRGGRAREGCAPHGEVPAPPPLARPPLQGNQVAPAPCGRRRPVLAMRAAARAWLPAVVLLGVLLLASPAAAGASRCFHQWWRQTHAVCND